MTPDETIALYGDSFRHFTCEQLLEVVATMTVQTKIGGATFTITPRNYPIDAVKRLLTYGCRRELNDGVAGLETDKEKVDTVSLKLGEWESGKYTEKRLRVPGLTLENEIRAKIILRALPEDEVKRVKDMDKEKRNDFLLGLWADNTENAEDETARELIAEFDRLIAEATRPKAKIALKIGK